MTMNDRFIGMVLFIISIYIFYYVATVQYHQFGDDPGPGLMPLIVGVGLALCSIGLLLWPKKIEGQNDDIDSEEKKEGVKTEKIKGYKLRTVIVALAIVLYVILLNLIGFLISSTIFMLALMIYLSQERNKKTIMISVITSVVVSFSIYYIFEEYLNIFLP